MIFNDPDHKEWTRWDYKIANAHHLLEHYEVEGWPVWLDTSPRVAFDVKERVSRSAAALEKKQFEEQKALQKRQEKNKDAHAPFGRKFYAVPKTIDGGPMPTKREWLEAQSKGDAPGTYTKTDGTVVQTAANPEMMREFREKAKARKAQKQTP